MDCKLKQGGWKQRTHRKLSLSSRQEVRMLAWTRTVADEQETGRQISREIKVPAARGSIGEEDREPGRTLGSAYTGR